MKDDKKIKERAYDFSINIIKLVIKLPKDTAGFVLGRQLVQILKRQLAPSVKMISYLK
jgi:hypothetical protein